MYKIVGADGKEYGPVSLDQLRQWIAQGRVNAQTRVLAGDGTEWKTAPQFPEFADLLTGIMGDMLDGTWRKGLYRDFAGVLG